MIYLTKYIPPPPDSTTGRPQIFTKKYHISLFSLLTRCREDDEVKTEEEEFRGRCDSDIHLQELLRRERYSTYRIRKKKAILNKYNFSVGVKKQNGWGVITHSACSVWVHSPCVSSNGDKTEVGSTSVNTNPPAKLHFSALNHNHLQREPPTPELPTAITQRPTINFSNVTFTGAVASVAKVSERCADMQGPRVSSGLLGGVWRRENNLCVERKKVWRCSQVKIQDSYFQLSTSVPPTSSLKLQAAASAVLRY